MAQAKPEPINAIAEIRQELERLGGSVGPVRSNARWIELHGPFTPEQLRRIAKGVEKAYQDKS